MQGYLANMSEYLSNMSGYINETDAIKIILAPLLTSGIIGTTLSLTIFFQLVDRPYKKNSFGVLGAAACFALSTFSTLAFINIDQDMNLLVFSRTLLTTGIVFILITLIPLYKMIETEGAARETDQMPNSDLRATPEWVNSMSP